jgi:hypothetical protein
MAETRAESFGNGLVPMGFAADVQRSVDFYQLRGTELRPSRGFLSLITG